MHCKGYGSQILINVLLLICCSPYWLLDAASHQTLNNADFYTTQNTQVKYQNSTFRTVCYYPMSNSLNASVLNPLLPGLDPFLCSHLLFIPSIIDDHNNVVPATEDHAEIFQRVIPLLRKMNPQLTIMVSNGGKFDPVLGSMKNTSIFVQSAVDFLKKYDFDGIDLDWEFPGWANQHRPKAQIHNFSMTIMEMRKAFDSETSKTKRHYLLSMAVCSVATMAEEIYEFDYMKKALDFVNVMGYDFYGPGENFYTDYNCPLYPGKTDNKVESLSYSATYYGSKLGRDKVVVGFPFYCHAYTLYSPDRHGFHDYISGKGECDQKGYTCPCGAIKNKGATSVWDNTSMVPYIYYGNQWVSYENERSITLKTKWIKDHGFSGLMIWNMEADDYKGECNGTKYPLMKAVLAALKGQ